MMPAREQPGLDTGILQITGHRGIFREVSMFGSKPVEQNDDYELAYWHAHPTLDAVVERYRLALEVLRVEEYLGHCRAVADVGCGPFGGIFSVRRFPKMFAVDPLWDEYSTRFPHEMQGIVKVKGHAQRFESEPLDGIFTMNALDHSGDLSASAQHLADHLVSGGRILLHVHMRTRRQLNEGHKMILDERRIEKAFRGLKQKWKQIEEECPFDRKPYRSYLGLWQKD